MYKYVIEFSKLGLIKHTSHLDMVRLFKRTFKKANIKLVHSQGFNPHPKMAFVLPLSLGYESTCELIEIETEEAISDIDEKINILNFLMPEGISIISIKKSNETKNLSGRVVGAEYIIGFPIKLSCGCNSCGKPNKDEDLNNNARPKTLDNEKDELGEAVKRMSPYWNDFCESFMKQEEIIVSKKVKSKHRKNKFDFKEVDIKHLIYDMTTSFAYDTVFLTARIKAGSTENLNPELLLKAVLKFSGLATEKEEAKIMRSEIIFK